MAAPSAEGMPPTMPPPMPPGGYGAMPSKRPIGVAIIAVLSLLAGLVEVLGGAALLGVAAIGATVGAGFLAAFAAIIGVVLLLVGLVTLAVAIGPSRMGSWGCCVRVILNIAL